jgi:hypothetical protein
LLCGWAKLENCKILTPIVGVRAGAGVSTRVADKSFLNLVGGWQ